MLEGIDLLIYDIQDIGARFYTYISTMGLIMEAAAESGIPCLILDRPNPLTGKLITGPILNLEASSFVGFYAKDYYSYFHISYGGYLWQYNILNIFNNKYHIL